MPYPVPEVEEPIIDPKTGRQTANFNLFLNQFMNRFDAIDSAFVGALFGPAGAMASQAQTTALQALSMARRAALSAELAGVPVRQQPAAEIAIAPFRRQWSITKVIPDTEANITLYDSSANPESLFVATDTFKIYYSYQGAAWTQLAFISDAAFSSSWNGVAYLTPSQNAVYDAIVAVTGQYQALFDHYADVGNVGTGEDDLYSDTLAAGQFAANGDKVIGTYCGVFVGAALSSQDLKFYVAGTLCFDTGLLAIGAATTDNWTLQVVIIRVSASVLRVAVSAHTDFASLGAPPKYTEITGLTLANTQIVKITGESSGAGAVSNQVIAKMSTLAYSKSA